MDCRVKPYFFPEVWMTIGGLRLAGLSDRSRLGEESREEGFEDSDRGEMGLGCRPPGESSEKQKDNFLLNVFTQSATIFVFPIRCISYNI